MFQVSTRVCARIQLAPHRDFAPTRRLGYDGSGNRHRWNNHLMKTHSCREKYQNTDTSRGFLYGVFRLYHAHRTRPPSCSLVVLRASSGHLEVVQLLLDKGADISVANAGGWTPLNSAANSGHLEVVQLLLDKGADYNAQSESYGNTLHVASHKGHVKIAEMLSNKAADFSYKDH